MMKSLDQPPWSFVDKSRSFVDQSIKSHEDSAGWVSKYIYWITSQEMKLMNSKVRYE